MLAKTIKRHTHKFSILSTFGSRFYLCRKRWVYHFFSESFEVHQLLCHQNESHTSKKNRKTLPRKWMMVILLSCMYVLFTSSLLRFFCLSKLREPRRIRKKVPCHHKMDTLFDWNVILLRFFGDESTKIPKKNQIYSKWEGKKTIHFIVTTEFVYIRHYLALALIKQ